MQKISPNKFHFKTHLCCLAFNPGWECCGVSFILSSFDVLCVFKQCFYLLFIQGHIGSVGAGSVPDQNVAGLLTPVFWSHWSCCVFRGAVLRLPDWTSWVKVSACCSRRSGHRRSSFPPPFAEMQVDSLSWVVLKYSKWTAQPEYCKDNRTLRMCDCATFTSVHTALKCLEAAFVPWVVLRRVTLSWKVILFNCQIWPQKRKSWNLNKKWKRMWSWK